MKVSIITISYNNEKDIRGTINSVIDQTYDNIEYIVIDGGSDDKTLDIVEEYKRSISKVVSEPDKGIYDAINKGIKYSTGDIVGLIHAGDRLFDDTVIEDIVKHFKEHHCDASYGHSLFVDGTDKPVRVNKSPEFKKRLFKRGWMPSHQSVYIKREIFDNLGYYRIDLGGSGDYEFILRYFYFNDLVVKRLDRFVLKFSLGGTSTTGYHRIFKVQNIHAKCWKLNGKKAPFYLIPMKLGRKIPQFSAGLVRRIFQ